MGVDRLSVMETYVCVVETGSFSAAAKRLDVGQPAVSKAIAQLEKRLGTRLLIRSTRGLTPTEAGERFYEGACRTIADANETELAARGSGAGFAGRLRVCAPVTFARLHIIPKLGAFLDAHPDLHVEIVLDDRPIDLLAEGIDVALRLGDPEDSSMTGRKIDEARRFVLGTPAYFARAGEPQVPADLAAHHAIVYAQAAGGSGAWEFRRRGEVASVALVSRMSVTAAEGVRAAVLADMGLAVASEWMFAPELESGAVKVVLADWYLPTLTLWALYPSGRLASTKARGFVDFLLEAMYPWELAE
jgi:DNA-binding transcriptional LysR family regulator